MESPISVGRQFAAKDLPWEDNLKFLGGLKKYYLFATIVLMAIFRYSAMVWAGSGIDPHRGVLFFHPLPVGNFQI